MQCYTFMIKLHFCVILKSWNVEVINFRIWSLFCFANFSVFVLLPFFFFNHKKTEENDDKEADWLYLKARGDGIKAKVRFVWVFMVSLV